ncbi:MAG: NupC/NupG family nucleoside CNT transporter [Deltaproteobacteria bacterium]|nr:MAG: NupC/NupG family nucleoside CNT transporter [Deltaproteobacteria bacterium]
MFALAYAASTNRRAIRWRPVAVAWIGQWMLGLVLLGSETGRRALESAASFVQGVLDHAFAGSAFVFGDLGAKGGGDSGLGVVFAFQVLPTIVFVASLFGVLYHVGIMQRIVALLARLFMGAFGISGAEALSVAASIFMGQTEAPLTIRPYLDRLTESELFTVMVAGMASVSGAILGAYVLIGGVEMSHLLTAVAMTAPASVAMAKIVVPETDRPMSADTAALGDLPKAQNVLDAASRGASDGLKLAVNVGAMLVAFIALVSLCNAAFGVVDVGGEPLRLERILGWLFSPLALAMGVPWQDVPEVAQVLGTRTVLNELLAYAQLHDLAGAIGSRAQAIATIAICGFAGIASIGIQIGGLGAIVPGRKDDIARLGVRALVAATLANFSSACVAGVVL